MSYCDEDEVPNDPTGLPPVPFEEAPELHKRFVRTLHEDMGWSFLQIGKFFGRTEVWATRQYPPSERPRRPRVIFGWEKAR